jgi:hypothetical protein
VRHREPLVTPRVRRRASDGDGSRTQPKRSGESPAGGVRHAKDVNQRAPARGGQGSGLVTQLSKGANILRHPTQVNL